MTIIGTSYYPSLGAAYKKYGKEIADEKIKEGLINIGKPNLLPGQSLFTKTPKNKDDFVDPRYFIEDRNL